MTDGRHIAHEDLALHAMQALSAEEAAAVRLHLTACAGCRAELAALNGDLALVAMSVDQHPLPEGARRRFLDRLASVPRQPAGAPLRPPAIPINRRRPAVRASNWIAWAAAAALLALSIAQGVRMRVLSQQLKDASRAAANIEAENQHARAVLDVLMAPGAQHVLLTAGKNPPQPSARAVYLPARGALILEASNLKPLPEGKTYQLWVIPAGGAPPIPAGLFRPDPAGNASVVLPSIPQGIPAKAFGVTIEDAGGAERPTLPIVLAGAVSASGG